MTEFLVFPQPVQPVGVGPCKDESPQAEACSTKTFPCRLNFTQITAAELSGGRNCAAVQQEHHAEKQDQRGSQQRENSPIEGALPGRAQRGSRRVAERAALGEGALRQSQNCE